MRGYAEVRTLGHGSAGPLLLAVHDEMGVAVAIRHLAEDVGWHGGGLTELNSPYVIRVWEWAEQERAVAVELVDGVSLRTLLHEHGPLGQEGAAWVFRASLRGLADLHGHGTAHPRHGAQNVLVTRDGRVKLADVGLVGPGASTAASTVDPAADLAAAVAVFAECLGGPADGAPWPQRAAGAAELAAEVDAVARHRYGADWALRGREQLAARAGLEAKRFPLTGSRPLTGKALAGTSLGPVRRPRPARPRYAARTPALSGVAAMLIVVAVTIGLAQLRPSADAGEDFPTPDTERVVQPPQEPVGEPDAAAGDRTGSAPAQPASPSTESVPPQRTSRPETRRVPSAPVTRATPPPAPRVMLDQVIVRRDEADPTLLHASADVTANTPFTAQLLVASGSGWLPPVAGAVRHVGAQVWQITGTLANVSCGPATVIVVTHPAALGLNIARADSVCPTTTSPETPEPEETGPSPHTGSPAEPEPTTHPPSAPPDVLGPSSLLPQTPDDAERSEVPSRRLPADPPQGREEDDAAPLLGVLEPLLETGSMIVPVPRR